MNWGGIIAGAVGGASKAALSHIEAEEEARRRMALEEQRSRIEEQRQIRLLEYRAKLDEKTKLGEYSGPLAEARTAYETKKRDEQFAFDTNPDNVRAKATAAGIIAENTPFDLSPGQERHVNGKVIKNSTPTNAEITRDLYEKGFRGLSGKDDDKLPPGYVNGMKDLNKDDDDLAKQMRELRVKMIEADPDKQKAFEAEIGRLNNERIAIRDNRMALAIEHGQLDANAHARSLAPQIKSLDQLNSVVQGSYRKFGPEWGEKIEQGLMKAGVFHRLEGDLKNNAEGKKATDWGGRPGIVQKEAGGSTLPLNRETDLLNESKYEREVREIALGKRKAHSPEVQEELDRRNPGLFQGRPLTREEEERLRNPTRGLFGR